MSPSRKQIEARITALLLGELPADEAELLRFTISQDTELQKLHDELASTIVLVRDVVKAPAAASEKSEPLKLSADRREKLLATFKQPRKEDPLSWLKRIDVSRFQAPRLLTVLAVIAIMAVLAAMMLPSLAAAKKKSQKTSALAAAKQRALEEQIRLEDEKAATPTLPALADAITVAAAPVISPPPSTVPAEAPMAAQKTEIVLPREGKPDSGGVYSQNVVGYANVSVSGQSLPTGAASDNWDFKTGEFDAKSRVAGEASAAFALDDSAVNHLDRSGKPSSSPVNFSSASSLAVERKPQVVAEPAPVVSPMIPGRAVNGFSGSVGGGGGGGELSKELASAQSPEIARGKFLTETGQDKNNLGWFVDGVVANGGTSPQNLGEEVRRGEPKSTINFEISQNQNEQSPALAVNEPAKVPAPKLNGSTDRYYRSTVDGKSDANGFVPPAVPASVGGVVAADRATDASYLFFETDRDNVSKREPVQTLGDIPASGALFASSTASAPAGQSNFGLGVTDADVVVNKSGSGTLTLSGANAFANGNVVNNGTLDVAAKQKDSLSRDDVAGVRYLTTANADPSYINEKKHLTQLTDTRRLLTSKITAAQVDLSIPTTTMVQVVDAAEPNTQQSFWQGLKGEYASTARLKVENDGGVTAGLNVPSAAASSYDPYFVQTTFELIKSSLVLSNVVNQLGLDGPSAPGNGGQRISKAEVMERLKSQLQLKPIRNTKLIEVTASASDPKEAARIANAVAESYRQYRVRTYLQQAGTGLNVLKAELGRVTNEVAKSEARLKELAPKAAESEDKPLPKATPNSPIPQPEFLCRENNFSTFSLNVSDVSFKLAAASLERGQLPDAASIRSEEFINAFDYRDPEAKAGQPLAFAAERARYPFAHNRDLLRFSVKTAAAGRAAGRPLNLVLLLDNSGSMERADRVAVIREALHVLAGQLQPQDTVSVVTFARTARLWAEGVSGDTASAIFDRVGGITPEGGTNLEEAMRLAYETARKHYSANGMNRVVLLTDGAANLGNVSADALKEKVEAQRKQGIALDCFGIGFEDYNDDLLEQLSSHGDGRYAFLNSPEDAQKDFAAKLAGALQIAAQDVKVQVEFNPQRVTSWRQIGYAKHQLTKEQFRDNTVDAAEIAAKEAGNALYTVETKADGIGPVATVRVRYKVPGTSEYRERSWNVEYEGVAPALENSSPAMRLAATASAFSEWLAASPFAQEVTLDELQKSLSGVPQIYGADVRPKQLETMLREAKSVAGK